MMIRTAIPPESEPVNAASNVFIKKCASRGLTIQIPQARDTPTGEWLRKLDNRCITQTVHKLKGQPALAPARC